MNSNVRIMITEQDAQAGAAVVSRLHALGYRPLWKQDPRCVISDITAGKVSAAIVNLSYPDYDLDGFDILNTISPRVAIPLFVVVDELDTCVLSKLLQYPVADVLGAGYTHAELIFRLKRALNPNINKHNQSALQEEQIQGMRAARELGDILVKDHALICEGIEVPLSLAEEGIISVLADKYGEYVGRDYVLEAAECGIAHSDSWFSTTIHRFRRKLESHNIPLCIHLRKGIGLQLRKKK